MADKGRKNGPMRLDRFLAEMGYGTRTQVKDMVKKGRVRMNGEAVKDADRKVNPESDLIEVDRSQVAYARMEYYMLNKPQGVVSATEDRKYPAVVGLIREALRKDLFPVGRLDIDTEGLLLITNDGELAHNLLSPKKHVDKVYLAYVSGGLTEDAVRRFEEGIELEDGTMTLPAKLKIQGAAGQEKELQEVLVTIREGKFHQIKRMFEALGCRVEYLKRISMGPLSLDPELEPGEYRPLTPEEESSIKDCGNRRKRV
ncbi:MAG: pseudouridine synthase [Enterocloster clostridioformis]|uniref:pseudouridine synthase n=1 Tax=Enterocloster clostridioformis TaxID=1531 RepID=UPI00040FD19F|nr:pseudouridine synthase [Enterocloster clostridioformis]MDY5478735.1 pseudouridine synthase [Enterocloster clostridioformis]